MHEASPSESGSSLTGHQTVLLELWHVLDEICRRNQIPYQLFAGSALGAVRHQGIIPWDDDLDVVMLREDYNRFMDVAESELDANRYFLQREFTEHWPMFFSKLRKNNTACIERFVPKDPQLHMGIYIDIFPCDNLADNPIKRKLQFLASKVVIAKSLEERGYLTDRQKNFYTDLQNFSEKSDVSIRRECAGPEHEVRSYFFCRGQKLSEEYLSEGVV